MSSTVAFETLALRPASAASNVVGRRMIVDGAMSEQTAAQTGALDAQSRAWLAELRGPRGERERAIGRLHDLLLRAARFEVGRRAAALAAFGYGERDDIAQQSADDALVAILAKLDGYRGASRFTTWAYKFVLLEVGVKLRRRAWHGRELPAEAATIELHSNGRSAYHDIEVSELLGALTRAIDDALTPHQREVLVATTLNDVPIDVLAERLNSTRGALYKTLHDARRKLRAALCDAGFDVEGDRHG